MKHLGFFECPTSSNGNFKVPSALEHAAKVNFSFCMLMLNTYDRDFDTRVFVGTCLTGKLVSSILKHCTRVRFLDLTISENSVTKERAAENFADNFLPRKKIFNN